MFSKAHLHHAYCVEGNRRGALASIKTFIEKELCLSIVGNPDVLFFDFDTFTIDNGRNLIELSSRKALGERKVFVVAFNFINQEAQNALLKLTEEPSPNTHFFIVVPSAAIFLPTLKSRLLIVSRSDSHEGETNENKKSDEFVKSTIKRRLESAKALASLVSDDEQSKIEILEFLERLERHIRGNGELDKRKALVLEEVIKAKRQIFTRSPSLKMILEHLCLVI